MSTITRIVQQKQQERANIFLDGKFAFGISLEEVFENKLEVGKELSREEVEKLKEKASGEKTYLRTIEFGTRRPRSEKEYKLWFRKKKAESPELVEGLMKKLTNLGLINDLAFAKWWVEQRTTFRPKSRRALRMELAQKGVSREIVDEVLQNEELPSEEEQILRVAKKRWEKLKNLETKERKNKLMQFLARRGFGWDSIKEAIRKIDSGEDLE